MVQDGITFPEIPQLVTDVPDVPDNERVVERIRFFALDHGTVNERSACKPIGSFSRGLNSVLNKAHVPGNPVIGPNDKFRVFFIERDGWIKRNRHTLAKKGHDSVSRLCPEPNGSDSDISAIILNRSNKTRFGVECVLIVFTAP